MEDRYRLGVEVKMRLTQDTGSKIRNRYEKLRLELEGRQEVVTQHGKALREYKCPNCGGSVDILGGGVCDYCNAAVDSPYGYIMKHKDFSVVSYKPDNFFYATDWMDKAVDDFKLLLPFNRFLNYTVDEYLGRV